MNIIIIFKYIFDNVRRWRDSTDYVLAFFKIIKVIDVSIYNQLYFIYNDLKSKFCRNLTRFIFIIIMNQFLKKWKIKKKLMKYIRFKKS